MSTLSYPCGCSITRSMFGKQEIVAMHLCLIHLQELANMSLDSIAEQMLNMEHDYE